MFKSSRLLKVLIAVAFTGLIVFTHATLYQSDVGIRVERTLLDFWFRLRGPLTPPDDVLMITMDEDSYQNLNVPLDEPWPRALHAKLLQKLARAGAKKVLFDILFLGPGADPKADEELATSFGLLPTVIGAEIKTIKNEYGLGHGFDWPYELFTKSAATGLVSLPEHYGYVRTFPERYDLESGDSNMLPLSFAASDISQSDLPTADDFINFYGPALKLHSYSYSQVLEEAVPFPDEKLKDKTVFVGLLLRSELGPQQKDSFLTSYSENGRHFGLEIHATVAANLLHKNWIRTLGKTNEQLALGLLLAIICLASFLLTPIRAGYISFILCLSWLSASFFLFKNNWFIPGLSVVGIFAPAVYLVSTLISYFIARQGQRKLRQAIALYISPRLASQVTKNPIALGLGGKNVVATALFTDLANFTTMSEKMSAEAVTELLNDYFTELVDIVFEEQGTLIKFIGDSVFALWGAPIEMEGHAEAAFKAGLAMANRLAKAERLKKYPQLETRIGLHTGPMVVGNLGSRKRFDFTAIGDSVNLASRVEGLNKYLGTSILITEAVRSQLTSESKLICMGRAQVVGKTESVKLYTKLDALSEEGRQAWEMALNEFGVRNWDKAQFSFEDISNRYEVLKAAASFYLEQLKQHRILQPNAKWAGELILVAK